MTNTSPQPLTIEAEFEGAELGDARRSRRLVSIARAISRDPSLSIPRLLGGDAALEATYRLLNSEAVKPEGILAPHVRMALHRADSAGDVLCVHDTSTFEYGATSRRTGLGTTRGRLRGFLAHVSLLVSRVDKPVPLGTAAIRTWVRPTKKPKVRPEERTKDPDRESRRWFDQAAEVQARLNTGTRTVHVMDREGDAYDLFAKLGAANARFIVRATHDRTLASPDTDTKLWDLLPTLTVHCEREVPLTKRRRHAVPAARRIHPPRTARTARLSFAAAHVQLKRPRYAPKDLPPDLRVAVVHVKEVQAPDDETPVEWVLFTTESVETEAEILKVVDAYRARWLIEELFKALKTGCAFMQRQMESYDALVNALAISLPIAWRLLLLRGLSRTATASASVALSTTQLAVLRAVSKVPLPDEPTLHEAALAIATLGGHIRNNGPPGWQVLGRGLHDLLLLEVGWAAREAAQRCDR